MCPATFSRSTHTAGVLCSAYSVGAQTEPVKVWEIAGTKVTRVPTVFAKPAIPAISCSTPLCSLLRWISDEPHAPAGLLVQFGDGPYAPEDLLVPSKGRVLGSEGSSRSPTMLAIHRVCSVQIQCAAIYPWITFVLEAFLGDRENVGGPALLFSKTLKQHLQDFVAERDRAQHPLRQKERAALPVELVAAFNERQTFYERSQLCAPALDTSLEYLAGLHGQHLKRKHIEISASETGGGQELVKARKSTRDPAVSETNEAAEDDARPSPIDLLRSTRNRDFEDVVKHAIMLQQKGDAQRSLYWGGLDIRPFDDEQVGKENDRAHSFVGEKILATMHEHFTHLLEKAGKRLSISVVNLLAVLRTLAELDSTLTTASVNHEVQQHGAVGLLAFLQKAVDGLAEENDQLAEACVTITSMIKDIQTTDGHFLYVLQQFSEKGRRKSEPQSYTTERSFDIHNLASLARLPSTQLRYGDGSSKADRDDKALRGSVGENSGGGATYGKQGKKADPNHVLENFIDNCKTSIAQLRIHREHFQSALQDVGMELSQTLEEKFSTIAIPSFQVWDDTICFQLTFHLAGHLYAFGDFAQLSVAQDQGLLDDLQLFELFLLFEAVMLESQECLKILDGAVKKIVDEQRRKAIRVLGPKTRGSGVSFVIQRSSRSWSRTSALDACHVFMSISISTILRRHLCEDGYFLTMLTMPNDIPNTLTFHATATSRSIFNDQFKPPTYSFSVDVGEAIGRACTALEEYLANCVKDKDDCELDTLNPICKDEDYSQLWLKLKTDWTGKNFTCASNVKLNPVAEEPADALILLISSVICQV
ncbi:hypothetical protein BC832DRAFT_540737 [Gaertneriomyces semiglobifer]|nr:hypothetical protein BC832DRAFT_540737 [Gaertneriomyces semiglobifer]